MYLLMSYVRCDFCTHQCVRFTLIFTEYSKILIRYSTLTVYVYMYNCIRNLLLLETESDTIDAIDSQV